MEQKILLENERDRASIEEELGIADAKNKKILKSEIMKKVVTEELSSKKIDKSQSEKSSSEFEHSESESSKSDSKLEVETLDKVSQMDPQDLMQLLQNKDKLLAALRNGDMTDPKVREMLRKLREAGLTPDDLIQIAKLDSSIMSDIVAKSEQNKADRQSADAASGKLSIKDMQAQLEADKKKQQAEMYILNVIDDLEDAYHINIVIDNMSEKDKQVFETLNAHAPKLVSK